MRQRIYCGSLVIALVSVLSGASVRAAEDKPAAKPTAFDTIRALAGTWVAVGPVKEGEKPKVIIFKATSGNSAVIETMFAGTDHEMVNVYTIDGETVVMTHYCSMGNQPHMKLASAENGVLQFQFVGCANIKSRDEAHMDSVEITIKGDTLTEKWGMYQDGKVTGYHSFDFKRQ